MLTRDTRPYFDPRSGEQITADEFVKRYTINAFMFVERGARGRDATRPSLRTYGGKCRYCSSATPDGVEVCESLICQSKAEQPTAPATSWAVPTPAKE